MSKTYDYTLTNTDTGVFEDGQIVAESDDDARRILHKDAIGKYNTIEIYHLYNSTSVFTDEIDLATGELIRTL